MVDSDDTHRHFEQPFRVRTAEVDSQNVVFNGWYLFYFDDAMADFIASRGLTYTEMLDSGFDVQLVNAEIDWRRSLRWPEEFAVRVSTARTGTTSFALDYEARVNGEVACSARITYVVIATDGSGKRPIPPHLLLALSDPRPLR